MPGTVYQDHGARIDAIVRGKGGLDRGGANNLICPLATASENTLSEATNGFLVNVKKVDVVALAEEYPEEFKREYDPADGPQNLELAGWLIQEQRPIKIRSNGNEGFCLRPRQVQWMP